MINFPLFVKWNITNKCNLRCKHCFKSNYEEEFDFLTIKKFISYFAYKKLAAILLTGGEPLFRSDILEIAEEIARTGMAFSMATNGTLITEDIAKKLIENKIMNFQVSLESHDKYGHDDIRGNGTFEKTINGIKILKKYNAKVIIAWTLTKYNYMNIKKMINLAEALSADALRLMLYLPIKNEYNFNLSIQDIKEIVKIISKLEKSKIKIIYPCFLPSDFNFTSLKTNTVFSENTLNIGCGAGIINAVLNADRTLAPCDLLSEIEKSIFINEPDDIDEIWNNNPVFTKWKNFKLLGNYCSSCHYNKICGMGCRAAAYVYNNDWEADDELCFLRGFNA